MVGEFEEVGCGPSCRVPILENSEAFRRGCLFPEICLGLLAASVPITRMSASESPGEGGGGLS